MKQKIYPFFIFSILLTNVYSSEVSVEDFFKDSNFPVQISPDGRYFATYMEDKTTSRIVIIERESNKIRMLTLLVMICITEGIFGSTTIGLV